jgi:hypothetical protein
MMWGLYEHFMCSRIKNWPSIFTSKLAHCSPHKIRVNLNQVWFGFTLILWGWPSIFASKLAHCSPLKFLLWLCARAQWLQAAAPTCFTPLPEVAIGRFSSPVAYWLCAAMAALLHGTTSATLVQRRALLPVGNPLYFRFPTGSKHPGLKGIRTKGDL